MKFFFIRGIKENASPFLLFSPFLFLYILIILVLHSNTLVADEIRYLTFAKNLVQGFYTTPGANIHLTNGPGYPIILVPFVALDLPLVVMVLLNAFFYYLSVIFVFKTLRQVTSFKIAIIFSLFWACFYNSFQEFPRVLTEPFASLLVTSLAYYLVSAFGHSNLKRRKYIFYSGFLMGYLVLTKIIFGYVLIFMLGFTAFLWVLNRRSDNYRRGIYILLLAFATTFPYLTYTYYLTGKFFYWGSSGGDSLYWMTSPYKNEFGDWRTYPNVARPEDYTVPYAWDSLEAHHKKDIDEVYKYNEIDRDDAYKRIAFKNIKSDPINYLRNCLSNIGRLIFSYPYSYTLQNNKTLFRLPMTGTIVLLSLFCIIPTLINWKKIFFPIRFMLFFVLIYLGLSVLVSGYTRMFTIVAPILLLWIAFVIQRSVKVKLKFNENREA